MTQINNVQISSWIKDAYHDDKMTIYDFLIAYCDKLSIFLENVEVKLFALMNGDTIYLYSSCNSVSADTKHPTEKPPVFKEENSVFDNNDCSSASMYISIYNKPRFVIHINQCKKLPNVRSSIQALTEQVILTVRLKEDRRFDLIHKNLVKDFFANSMDTEEAWKILSRYAVKLLPDAYPFNAGNESLAQVLTYSNNDKYLVLRANQEDNHNGNRYTDKVSLPLKLKVDETICGIVIEQNLEYLDINPAEKCPNRYQAYLFTNYIAKSELVFPVRQPEGNIVAIINFEHKEQGAFCGYTIETMRRAVQILEPFVTAIIQNEKNQHNKEISLLYITTEIIQRMSSLYRHKIGSKLLVSRMIINKFKNKYLDDNEFHDDLKKLDTNINDFNTASNGFLRDLPNYMKSKDIMLISNIIRAKNDLDADKLKSGDGIEINIDSYSSEIVVYASDMLKEHLYNLLNNSILAIKQRVSEGKQIGGCININITKKVIKDTVEREKSTSPSRIYVSISDNGGGIPEKDYPRVLDFGESTRLGKGGTGYGLPAAREYIRSINGGDWETINEEGVGFTVKFFIQEFDSSFHNKPRQ